MAYTFLPEETVAEAATRVAREQLDRAIHELTERRDHDPATAVHNARKAIKRERSLLRLVAGTLPRTARRRENRALRDAARRLSGARDADALVATVDGLAERFAGQLPERAFTGIRDELAAGQGDHGANLDLAAGATAAASELDAVRERLADWRVSRDGWRAIEAGIDRAYTRGRQAYARAERTRSAETLHDWRKRAKDLWYHSQLLAEVGGPVLRGQAKDAHALADLLGDDHDLAVLDGVLAGGLPAPVDVDGVRELIAHRRKELQTQAFRLGRRVYAEKPKAFRRRMERYWRASSHPTPALTAPAVAPTTTPKATVATPVTV